MRGRPARAGRSPLRFDLLSGSGRQRLVLAVTLSLLMHAALITVGVKTGERPLRVPPPALQWVEVVPVTPARVPERPAAPMPLRAAVPSAAPAGQGAPAVAAQAPSGVAEAQPRMAAQDEAPLSCVAVQPLPGASSQQPAPVPWDSEGIARALQRERAWQRRHGPPAADALAAAPYRGAVSGVPSGQGVAVHESAGPDGRRVSRVEGPAGTYCVRVPSANRLPDQGAAPRLALPTHCL